MNRLSWLFVFIFISIALIYTKPTLARFLGGHIEQVSLSSSGELGNGDSASYPVLSISADGALVGFPSVATNLVVSDTNSQMDIFLRDRRTDTTQLVSLNSDGSQMVYPYTSVHAISDDNRYIVFSYHFGGVIPDDDATDDIYIRDVINNTVERVSITETGVPGNGDSGNPTLSGDGNVVGYVTWAPNLTGDSQYHHQAVVFNRTTNDLEVVSIGLSGEVGNQSTSLISLSQDGTVAAFRSSATNLVISNTIAYQHIFVRDLVSDTTTLITWGIDGQQGNQPSNYPYVAAGGDFVLFSSLASNLVPQDVLGYQDAFLYNIAEGTIELISRNQQGNFANNDSLACGISADGRFVAFVSGANNLIQNDTNSHFDVFVKDRQTGIIERFSIADDGTEADLSSTLCALSADGMTVAFASYASNLVPGTANSILDIFVRDGQASPLPTTTATSTPIPTASATATSTNTSTPTPQTSATSTNAPTSTTTPTHTPAPTVTPTNTPIPTLTPTNTPSITPTQTPSERFLYLPITRRSTEP